MISRSRPPCPDSALIASTSAAASAVVNARGQHPSHSRGLCNVPGKRDCQRISGKKASDIFSKTRLTGLRHPFIVDNSCCPASSTDMICGRDSVRSCSPVANSTYIPGSASTSCSSFHLQPCPPEREEERPHLHLRRACKRPEASTTRGRLCANAQRWLQGGLDEELNRHRRFVQGTQHTCSR